MTLYELNGAIAGFEPEIDEATGELLNAAELESLQMERGERIENIALWIKNLAAEITAIKNEEAALAERRKGMEKRADSLRRYLTQSLDGEKFETPKCKISWHSSTKTVVDEDFLSWALKNRDDLLTYKTPEPDKTAIKDALKAGEKIEHAQLVKTKNVIIK